MANKNPNMEPMLKKAEEKTKVAIMKVEAALKEMLKKQLKINFNSVAEESGVSKSFLYKIDHIRDRIETLRKQQEGLPTPRQAKRIMNDQSKDVIIVALKKRNKELEEKTKSFKIN